MSTSSNRSIARLLVAKRDAAQADFVAAVYDYDHQARIVDELDRALRQAGVNLENAVGVAPQTKHRRYLLAARIREASRLEAVRTRKDAARASLEEALSAKIAFELVG